MAGGDSPGAVASVEVDPPIHLGDSEVGISYKGMGKYEAVYDYDYAGGAFCMGRSVTGPETGMKLYEFYTRNE